MKSGLSKQARNITYNSEDRTSKMRQLSIGEQSAVFLMLSPNIQQSLLKELKISEIVDILDHMDMTQAERVISKIDNEKRREKIVSRLKSDVKEKMEYFLRFHPKASMSLIHFSYILLSDTQTVGEAADAIDTHYAETGRFPEVLVHHHGTLIGEVLMATLVRERNTSKLANHVTPIPSVTYQAEVSEIVEVLTTSKRKKVVVLDGDESVLGVIYADDALALFGKLPAESLYDFAGVDNSERPFDSIGRKVNNRYRWLILNLATCFLAGGVVLLFQDTLDTITILSVYIPIIAGMGGNAATQTFAVMVRGLTLGTISLKNAMPAIKREVGAAIVNGLIIGSIVALISTVWNGEPLLGVTVALALIGAHIVAGVAGAFVPLLMKHIGKDPAATSTIFITTATDVCGLLLLFGLATLILL
jgi:magnesium transporter